jgi:hypothetical protein
MTPNPAFERGAPLNFDVRAHETFNRCKSSFVHGGTRLVTRRLRSNDTTWRPPSVGVERDNKCIAASIKARNVRRRAVSSSITVVVWLLLPYRQIALTYCCRRLYIADGCYHCEPTLSGNAR